MTSTTESSEQTLLVINPDGSTHRETYRGKEPPLEQLQKIVGGYIELVPYAVKLDGQPAHMFVNEDGIAQKLEPNIPATRLCGGLHAIFGNAAIVPVRRARTNHPATFAKEIDKIIAPGSEEGQ